MRISTFVVYVLFFTAHFSYAQLISLQNLKEVDVTKGFYHLSDSSKKLQPRDVFSKTSNLQFQPANEKTVKAKNIDVYWLQFSVKNNTNFDEEWVFDFENWAFVDFYYQENQDIKLKKTGHLYPYEKRDYPKANKNYIKLSLKSGETKKCFVRLEYSLNISKIPQDLSFKISPRSKVDERDAAVGNVIFGFLGIFSVMFLYNLIIFFVTRLKSYAYYLFVLLFAFYFTSNNSGYLISLFSSLSGFPVWASHFELVGSELYAVAYLLFIQSLMNTQHNYPKWHQVLNGLIVSNIVISILFFIHFEVAFVLLYIISIATIFIIITLGIRCIKDRIPSASYLLLGYIANLMGVISIMFVLTGVLPKSDFTFYYSLPLGLTVEVILFSFALANMINILRKDNEEKQKKNIEQLLENQQLQTKVNRELEQKVAERTVELNLSLNRLRITQDQLVLKEKLASLGELTAGIAHEIQNPLNFVNNFSELSIELAQELTQEITKPKIDKELISDLVSDLSQNQQKINHHGQRASSIVKGMLEHSRTGTGERRLTNLNNLAQEYLNIAYQGLRARDASFNIEMKTVLDPDLPETEMVPQEMGRVLLNLFNNAFYATHEKLGQLGRPYQPEIQVSTQFENDKVELRIKDNGTGIPPEIINKIFQPFFTTKSTGEGTGLGLSISYDIITKGHHGEIMVESENGNYTEFIVKLPR
jgi:two-component system NtrC family sensor kinase